MFNQTLEVKIMNGSKEPNLGERIKSPISPEEIVKSLLESNFDPLELIEALDNLSKIAVGNDEFTCQDAITRMDTVDAISILRRHLIAVEKFQCYMNLQKIKRMIGKHRSA